jgi:hypothetical protein
MWRSVNGTSRRKCITVFCSPRTCSYANVRYLQVKFPLALNYVNITGTPPLSVASTFNMNDSNDTYARAVAINQHSIGRSRDYSNDNITLVL